MEDDMTAPRKAAGRNRIRLLVLALNLALLGGAPAQDLRPIEYDTDQIPASEYRQRREKLMALVGSDAVAFLVAAPEELRNADVEYQYRQDDNFLYLTGFPEPNAILMLVPAGVSVRDPSDTSATISVREVLFVQAHQARREAYTGRRYGPEGAMSKGIAYAVTLEDFPRLVRRVLYGGQAKILYLPDFGDGRSGEDAEQVRMLRGLTTQLGKGNSLTEVRDPSPLVFRMRAVKSPEEIRLIEKAVRISAIAHREAMKSCKPGMHEYEIAAVYEYVFRKLGAEYPAYPCIVGAAENSCTLHYTGLRRRINDGDVVLADCGAEYHGYASDITRTYPANGKFSPAQRRIYEIVLRAQLAAIDRMRPGTSVREVTAAAEEELENGLFALGLIKAKDGKEFRRFTLHGVSHAVGLDVHDVQMPVYEAGMVYTIEPGIYIAQGSSGVDPSYFNIGVRIEDTVLITPEGHRVLSDEAPKSLEAVEQTMRKTGVGDVPLD